jgi:hypothetical protein
MWREAWLTRPHKSTPEMRARIRELATGRDDFDRAVIALLDDFEAEEAAKQQSPDGGEEICSQCGGAGGDNHVLVCGHCGGSGKEPSPSERDSVASVEKLVQEIFFLVQDGKIWDAQQLMSAAIDRRDADHIEQLERSAEGYRASYLIAHGAARHLEQEVKRLREVLEEIANHQWVEAWAEQIARNALTQEPSHD